MTTWSAGDNTIVCTEPVVNLVEFALRIENCQPGLDSFFWDQEIPLQLLVYMHTNDTITATSLYAYQWYHYSC